MATARRGDGSLIDVYSMETEQLKKAVATSKGQVTRICNAMVKQIATVKPEEITSSNLTVDIMTKLTKIEEHAEIVTAGYQEWVTRLPAEKGTVDKRVNDFNKQLDEFYAQIYPFLGLLPAPQGAAPPGPTEKPPSRPPRPNLSLKPDVLLQDNTPIELKYWVRKFAAFYRTSQLNKLPVADQRAYLNSCLDATICQVLEIKAPEDTVIFDEMDPNGESCIKHLKDMWMDRYPLFQRRHAFFTAAYHNRNVKDIPAFLAKVEELGAVAEIDKMTESNICAYKALSAVSDKELRKSCWKEKNLTMERLRVLALERVREQENITALQTDVKAQLLETDRVLANLQQTLKDVTCWECQKKGHYANDCPSRKKKSASEVEADDDGEAEANAARRQPAKKSTAKKPFMRKKGGKVRAAEAEEPTENDAEEPEEAQVSGITTITEKVLGTFGRE